MRYGREPLEEIEHHNKGWLTAENCPPADVFIDGQEIKNVMSVNRKRGKAIVVEQPMRMNRRGEVLTRTLFGDVTVVLKDVPNERP